MTLILGCLTADFVVLSSDRRITRSDARGKPLFRVDSDVKTFQIGTDYLVGYCGVARFEHQPMDEWVTDLLKSVDHRSKLEVLQDAVAERVWSLGLHREAVAFMGVGFRVDAFGRRVPHRWTWSNALDENGDFDASDVQLDFRRSEETLPGGSSSLTSIGVKITEEETAMALDVVNGDGVPKVPTTLEAIETLNQRVAARNPAVGDRPLLTVLSREGESQSHGGYDAKGRAHPPAISGAGFAIRGVVIDTNATGLPGPRRDQLPPPAQGQK